MGVINDFGGTWVAIKTANGFQKGTGIVGCSETSEANFLIRLLTGWIHVSALKESFCLLISTLHRCAELHTKVGLTEQCGEQGGAPVGSELVRT